MATTANSKYGFELTSSETLAAHPKSGLATVVISGVCTNPDGVSFNFVATNNLDQRYPERFKVNWAGTSLGCHGSSATVWLRTSPKPATRWLSSCTSPAVLASQSLGSARSSSHSGSRHHKMPVNQAETR